MNRLRRRSKITVHMGVERTLRRLVVEGRAEFAGVLKDGSSTFEASPATVLGELARVGVLRAPWPRVLSTLRDLGVCDEGWDE